MNNQPKTPQQALERLRAFLRSEQILPPGEVPEPPWATGQAFRGAAMLYPESVEEVCRTLQVCSEARQPVVPMGGLTNLVRGCATRSEDLGLSLARLNAIEELDPVAQTMTVQAGVTLREAQEAAERAGLYFPVDIGARDNCMLGGNVSTNAGGTKVIRYGMIRDSVLGLEAVLADGTLLSSMNRYVKNNSGFDLKHLFIGTEGTLGIVTRIVFRLTDKPAAHNVALLGLNDYDAVLQALRHGRRRLGADLCGFEVMWNTFYRKAVRPHGPHTSPIGEDYPFYVIVEAMGASEHADNEFESSMTDIFTRANAADGVVAKSSAERDAIWRIRHEVEWLVRDAYNFDVSLRVADAAAYVESVTERVQTQFEDALVAAFGHLGDNNVHLSVLASGDRAEQDVARHVYDALIPFAGAISAEHGIGLEKRAYLPVSRSDAELALMATLKRTLDPSGILNPGKVVSADDAAAAGRG